MDNTSTGYDKQITLQPTGNYPTGYDITSGYDKILSRHPSVRLVLRCMQVVIRGCWTAPLGTEQRGQGTR